MIDERLKEIYDKIGTQRILMSTLHLDFSIIDEKLELYNEVIRLKDIIDKLETWAKEYSEKDTMSSIIFGVVVNHLQELKEGK